MTRARLKDDGTVVETLRDGSERPLVPELDWARVDATTDEEIAAQIAADEAEALRDVIAYARRNPAPERGLLRHRVGRDRNCAPHPRPSPPWMRTSGWAR